jgi:2-iminobutanoate/2-iminopropanoate deaminase
MAKVEVKHPDKKVSTGAYSAGVLVDGWVYVSGQGPLGLETGKAVDGTIKNQTRLTLAHIGKILEAAGCDFTDVVKSTRHLSDMRDFNSLNAVYAEFFPGVRPARTTVQSRLGKGMRVEIGVIARVPK